MHQAAPPVRTLAVRTAAAAILAVAAAACSGKDAGLAPENVATPRSTAALSGAGNPAPRPKAARQRAAKGGPSFSMAVTDPVIPDSVIVSYEGLEWVWASPCAMGGCTGAILVGKDGFGFATPEQWAMRPPASMFEGTKCAAPWFDQDWDHCDWDDPDGGFFGSVPTGGTGQIGSMGDKDTRMLATAETWLVRVAGPSTPGGDNTAPTAAVGGPYAGDEGHTITFSAGGSADANGDALTYAWDLDNDGDYADPDDAALDKSGADAKGVSASRVYGDNTPAGAPAKVAVAVFDPSGASDTAAVDVSVANVAPTAAPSTPARVDEGSPISLALTDPADVAADLPHLQYAFDCTGATPAAYGIPAGASSVSCATTDDGLRTIKGKVVDKDGGESEYAATVSVINVAPSVGALTVPTDLVSADTPVEVSATFTDPGSGDTHTGEVRWDAGGDFEPATISGSTVKASKVLPAGVYSVTLRVTDDDGGVGERTATAYVVVYDPATGFATGGGWINYGGASCPVLCRGTAGKANFGFVAKYQKGATAPTGTTEFALHAGALGFRSSSYEWLVVGGGRAQYKGTGTINGGGSYGFLLTAVDGEPDKFRIKIWDRLTGDEENTVFDNGADTPLDKISGGGSIVIHAR